MLDFITIRENTEFVLNEKKSKFIANLIKISSQGEAEEVIKKYKKQYHDARHNCIAYRVYDNGNIIEKSSDDGEPSGTAGAPMLEILKNNNLCNVLVIVTRYFGGILLGTGGLVRAYSDSVLKAIDNSTKVKKSKGLEATAEVEYNTIDNFKYYCKINNIHIINMEYSNVVICKIELENSIKEKLIDDIGTKKININNLKIICEKFINKSVEK